MQGQFKLDQLSHCIIVTVYCVVVESCVVVGSCVVVVVESCVVVVVGSCVFVGSINLQESGSLCPP